jgi:type IV pilus assembly protein PilE
MMRVTKRHMRMNNTDLLPGPRRRVPMQRGFTLIELVIAMVIASILAAIAIPSYSSYILRSRRTEAKSALLNMASLEERFFSTNNTYTTVLGNLGYPAAAATPYPFGNSYYQITAVNAAAAVAPINATSVGTPATYSITVAAIGTQASDGACLTFTITSGGVQTSTGTGTTCWQ